MLMHTKLMDGNPMLNLTIPNHTNFVQMNAPTILIIEDSEADRILMTKTVLEEWPGANVLHAEYLSDAYMIYRENQIDIFILDLHLPDAFGAITVESLRHFDRNSTVIAITSSEEPDILTRATESGATEVMHKSKLMTDQFIQTLRYHYKKSQRILA